MRKFLYLLVLPILFLMTGCGEPKVVVINEAQKEEMVEEIAAEVVDEYNLGDLMVLGGVTKIGIPRQATFTAPFWPGLDDAVDIGREENRFRGLYLSGNATTSEDIHLTNWQLGTPTYESVNDFFNLQASPGRHTGGEITLNDGQTFDIAAGTGIIRITDDDISQLKFFDWVASTTIDIATSSAEYIGIDYNAGSPIIVTKVNDNTWNLDTEFPLGSVTNQDGSLHDNENPWWTSDGLTNVIERFQAMGYVARDDYVGGLIIGVTGTRNPTLTKGTLWSRLTEFDITAKDTSGADEFWAWWRDGSGGWTRGSVASSTYTVTHYDDDSGGVIPIPAQGKFANFWVWTDSHDDGELMLIYPQNFYTSAAGAEAENVPVFPTSWYEHGILLGRILFEKNVDAPTQVQSVFSTTFIAAQASDHGNLTGLDDDDHIQYLLEDGSRDLSADWVVTQSIQMVDATITDRLYVATDLAIATTTPWDGYELAVTGDGVFDGHVTTTLSISVPEICFAGGNCVSSAVDLTQAQTVAGVKTFSSFPLGPGTTPTAGDELIDKTYCDALAGGFNFKTAVKAATADTTATSGPQTIDGYSAVAGNRILIKNATTTSNNGCYLVVDPGDWTICLDSDTDAEVGPGTAYFVTGGDTQAGDAYAIVTDDPITPGITELEFVQISKPPQYTAGDGMNLNTLEFETDLTANRPLYINSTELDIRLGYGLDIDDLYQLRANTSTDIVWNIPELTVDQATSTNRIYVTTDLAVATTTPWDGYELAVDGDIIASGKIFAETNMAIATSTPWADYELAVTGDIVASGNLLIVGGGQFARATSTDRLYVGTDLAIATTTPANAYELAVTGDGIFSGNLLVEGGGQFTRATTTDRLYVGVDMGIATTTPWEGYELAITGDLVVTGGSLLERATTTDRLYIGVDLAIATTTPWNGYEFAMVGEAMFAGTVGQVAISEGVATTTNALAVSDSVSGAGGRICWDAASTTPHTVISGDSTCP